MACIIFVPLFLQDVKGLTASGSGAIITPMLVSLIVGVIISGMIISKTCKYKLLSIIGFLVMGSGTVILMLLNDKSSNVLIIITMIIMGLGIGICMAIFNVTAQNVFPNSQLGVVTSSIQFSGRIGQTIASSILGTVFSNSLSKGTQTLNISKFSRKILSNSIHLVFVICAVVTLASLIIVLFMKEVPMSKKSSTEESEQTLDDPETPNNHQV